MPEPAKRAASWTTVAFADVVRQVKDKVDPAESGLERYIAGEHMDTDDLRIRRWGEIGDGYLGPAFHMRFKPSQVLYGSRRTYLRKVAVADFEGITANTTYVLEPKDPEVLLPDLLPFIMQTESFNQHSVRESKGSVNPYVNFSDLAWYEFALPPINEQRRIARSLCAAARHIDALLDLEIAAGRLRDSVLKAEFSTCGAGMPLADWCRSLITYGIVQAGPDTPGGVPYIRVSDMTAGITLSLSGMLRTSQEIAKRYQRSRVSAGDIVVALRGPVGLPRVIPPELEGANLTQGTARVAVKHEHCTDYVLWALQSPATLKQYAAHAKGSTFSEISLAALRTIEVPIRPWSEQERAAQEIGAVDHARQQVARRRLDAVKQYCSQRDVALGMVR